MENPKGEKAMMNGYRESDILIVSEKPLNKICDNKRMAEEVEKRRMAERNPSEQNRGRAQSRITLPNELDRIRHAAQKNREGHSRQAKRYHPYIATKLPSSRMVNDLQRTSGE